MRIQRVSVGSFGRMISRDFDLQPGMNVFYGPNESGKTTLMEFIRSTMVPTNKRNLYPERNKSNNGLIEAEEGGEPFVIQLDYKQRKGSIPDCISNMDPELYRSIHAMSSSDLDDDEVINSKEIHSKYLSIPGGEAVPSVIKTLDDRMMEQVGTTPKASSELNTCQTAISECQEKVSDLRSKSVSYSDLLDERDGLEADLKSLTEYNERARISNSDADRAELQKDSFARLSQYRERSAQIRSKPLADDDADSKYRTLGSEIASKEAAFGTIDAQRESMKSDLPGDEKEIRALSKRYSAVQKSYTEYKTRTSRPAVTRMVRNKFNPLVAVLGVAVMAVGAVPLALNISGGQFIAAGCVAVGAAVIAIYALMRPKHEETVRDIPNEKWIEDYESEVSRLMNESSMKHLSVESDVDSISEVMRALDDLDGNMPKWAEANSALFQARNDMTVFLTPFGGEEGFEKAKKEYRELLECESSIVAISESIRSAGYDPDKPFPLIERMPLKEKEQTDAAKRIGLLNERLDSIIRDGLLDQEIDRLSVLKADRERIIREGAKTVLSSYIVDSACADLYKNVQPEVLSIADSYLSMMTGGLYSIDSDPRNEDLTVVSDDGKKILKQCSSGTRSQVLLSLKLAIAKQMCGGKVPMILDDVLITFDSDRIIGACTALSQISSEMQILLFTCSETVLKVCEGLPGVNIIRM